MLQVAPLSVLGGGVDPVVTRFAVGQIGRHELLSSSIDPFFAGSEECYEKMAPSRPPKDRPWCRVLMNVTDNQTYVVEP